MYHPKEKRRRNKIRNLWLWLVCCYLLPTCNFHHRPFTTTKHWRKPNNRPIAFLFKSSLPKFWNKIVPQRSLNDVNLIFCSRTENRWNADAQKQKPAFYSVYADERVYQQKINLYEQTNVWMMPRRNSADRITCSYCLVCLTACMS